MEIWAWALTVDSDSPLFDELVSRTAGAVAYFTEVFVDSDEFGFSHVCFQIEAASYKLSPKVT